MNARWARVMRWMMLLSTGAVVFQAGGCAPNWDLLQTGFLGAITGMLFFLSKNV